MARDSHDTSPAGSGGGAGGGVRSAAVGIALEEVEEVVDRDAAVGRAATGAVVEVGAGVAGGVDVEVVEEVVDGDTAVGCAGAAAVVEVGGAAIALEEDGDAGAFEELALDAEGLGAVA